MITEVLNIIHKIKEISLEVKMQHQISKKSYHLLFLVFMFRQLLLPIIQAMEFY